MKGVYFKMVVRYSDQEEHETEMDNEDSLFSEMMDCQDGPSDFIRRHDTWYWMVTLQYLHIEVYWGMNDIDVTSTNYLQFYLWLCQMELTNNYANFEVMGSIPRFETFTWTEAFIWWTSRGSIFSASRILIVLPFRLIFLSAPWHTHHGCRNIASSMSGCCSGPRTTHSAVTTSPSMEMILLTSPGSLRSQRNEQCIMEFKELLIGKAVI